METIDSSSQNNKPTRVITRSITRAKKLALENANAPTNEVLVVVAKELAKEPDNENDNKNENENYNKNENDNKNDNDNENDNEKKNEKKGSSLLSDLHSHKRDAQIKFDAGPHIYTIELDNGVKDSGYMSVTTWNHSHFNKFDADAIIKKMMNGKNWNPQNVYYGKTAKEIKDGWNKNRDEAAREGTKLHYDIECYYNGIAMAAGSENNSPEYKQFIAFTKYITENESLANNYKPYRTEWMIWHEDLRFAGSIDMVFEREDGTLMIYDWKRCKEIKKSTSFNTFAKTECIDHIPDTNFWHYALQLNTYRAILEEKYGKKVSEMCLVCLHPDNASFQLHKVPVMDNEIKSLFDLRRETLNKKKQAADRLAAALAAVENC